MILLNTWSNILQALFGGLSTYDFTNIAFLILFLLLIGNFIYSIWAKNSLIKEQNATRAFLYKDRKDVAINNLINTLFKLDRSVGKRISDEEKDAIWTHFNDKFKKFIDVVVELYLNKKQDCKTSRSKNELIKEEIFNTLGIINNILEKVNGTTISNYYNGKMVEIKDHDMYKDMLEFVRKNGNSEQKLKLEGFRIYK
jgi:hypothetical protein